MDGLAHGLIIQQCGLLQMCLGLAWWEGLMSNEVFFESVQLPSKVWALAHLSGSSQACIESWPLAIRMFPKSHAI